ncbi:MAG: RNA polymerase sigma factor [Sandaracinaceae bacterium]
MRDADDPALFRRVFTRSVALLSRRWGLHRLAEVEDAVQAALMTAVERWPRDGRPENPAAWVATVAHRRLVDAHRRQAAVVPNDVEPPLQPLSSGVLGREIGDEVLRMMFVCCDPAIPIESQLVFTLKVLSGFSVGEVAAHLFVSTDNVYKRLSRARDVLKSRRGLLDLGPEQYPRRLDAVVLVIYLVFTEGHLASAGDEAIRVELCREALRLGGLLAEHPVGRQPKVAALMALMHLHASRLGSRFDGVGELVTLEEQDRSRWDRSHRAAGLRWLAMSAEGGTLSRYHAEAGIAAAHAMAPTFAETDWERIAACYALLERVAPSPWHRLNRALAVAELRGPEEGLALLADLTPAPQVTGSGAWAAALADLHRRAEHPASFVAYRRAALDRAPTDAVRRLLERRFDA